MVRIQGDLVRIDHPALAPEETHRLVFEVMNDAQRRHFQEHLEVDFAYKLGDGARFRVNAFMHDRGEGAVFRQIPEKIPRLDDLGLPPILRTLCQAEKGLVLVTGPTGSGKSSTLAAIIDLINETKYYHIVTIEDPIEFLHTHKNSTVHQRELHSDTSDFPRSLRAALRQAPKVILVGEMRDVETIEIALEASETGHLVFSTLHTIDASKTVDRIIGVFPKNEEHVIRIRLAQIFRYIFSQRLLPRADRRSRIAAIEILKSTSRTREYIEKGEAENRSLTDAMEQGELEGMQTFDGVLERMIRDGTVTQEDAMPYATNQNNLLLRLADIGAPRAGAPPPGLSKPDPTSILDSIER